jgi:hypothetical protein
VSKQQQLTSVNRVVLKREVLDEIRDKQRHSLFPTFEEKRKSEMEQEGRGGVIESMMEMDILGFNVKDVVWIHTKPRICFKFYTYIDEYEFDKESFSPPEKITNQNDTIFNIFNEVIFNEVNEVFGRMIYGIATLITKGIRNHLGMLREFAKIDFDKDSFEYEEYELKEGEHALRTLTPANFVIMKKMGTLMNGNFDVFQSVYTPIEEERMKDPRPGLELITLDDLVKRNGGDVDKAFDDFLSMLKGNAPGKS